MSKKTRPTFWFVAAGTGGHIFPGLEIARKLQEKLNLSPEDFLFFGTSTRLEAKVIPEHLHQFYPISAQAWKGKNFLSKILIPFSILVCVFQVAKAYFTLGRPKAMLSVGGYVSFPVSIFCILARIKIFIHEPNIKTGVANKIISKYAKAAYSVPFSDAEKVMKCSVKDYGNPVRPQFHQARLRGDARNILVLGGSQGARKLCEASLELLSHLNAINNEITLTLQSGQINLDFSLKRQAELGIKRRSTILPFISDLMPLLEKSDLVIARAGAMTLAELSIVGIPTILIPFPYAADDHQRVNAKLLEKHHAVRVVDEKDQNFTTSLSTHVRDLMLSGDSLRKRVALSEAFLKTARPKAGDDISNDIIQILKLH
ncbi:MAG: UDP-N-acetylglucosamine--N-acetylmuramyl-(pentapeptide) pyrophosphoryl-undecaprenol N-acetylglucosamine transferase [Proteobacteria bacterium]|nr:UDP-N-acetylglucosamine--N-acetylmuramyl-(pentapeptide) pyrophosphoryl-undecaprenol N-acetylglucosamine transferase [Pseudomonadota bacterium]